MGTESTIGTIPTVDLSPFFGADNDEPAKEKVKQTIAESCRTYGFFRILNHGVPTALMKRAMDLSRSFFDRPYEEKTRFSPDPGTNSPLFTGYMRQPEISGNNNEYFLMFKRDLGLNIYPTDPTEFRSTVDECFSQLSETALLIESILTDCMGLPANFIKNYDPDRNTDFMVALRYFPMTGTVPEENSNGLGEHQDGSCISFVFQDDVGGLEVLKDGQWISADPSEGSIVVNIGDILQVLTNNTFVSATHRVVRKERDRYSFAFFFNVDGEKWIEPLPRFSTEIGCPPKYRHFRYKDYMQLRQKNITLPREDFFDISRYAI